VSENGWIFDATPLIYLATVDRLSLVEHLAGRCLVPERVYGAVVTAGLDHGDTDARRIEQAVESGTFDTVSTSDTELTDRLRGNPNLSAADIAVLGCADERNGTAVMDEASGRDVAAVEGIETRGTAYLVCSLAKHGTIGVAEAREPIDAMVDAGWYCSPDLYARLVRTLDSVEESATHD
jgi:predicted nucleic acid-binding protein